MNIKPVLAQLEEYARQCDRGEADFRCVAGESHLVQLPVVWETMTLIITSRPRGHHIRQRADELRKKALRIGSGMTAGAKQAQTASRWRV